jgi:hypothetical protein
MRLQSTPEWGRSAGLVVALGWLEPETFPKKKKTDSQLILRVRKSDTPALSAPVLKKCDPLRFAGLCKSPLLGTPGALVCGS